MLLFTVCISIETVCFVFSFAGTNTEVCQCNFGKFKYYLVQYGKTVSDLIDKSLILS